MRTPRIQQLAEEGVAFRHAHCAASTCSASRACLLTGRYAQRDARPGAPRLVARRLHAVHRPSCAGFNASARSLDAGIGAVLDELDALGLREDTLVICTTDHGMAFPAPRRRSPTAASACS